ncbi:hypothetical protein B0J12DRAFT_770816 [Macrophomina phaseolina]|uniref:Uncharacterized protein n=1 Tax=Macrophomina phaseolina TaxID=35725 RepID=A0ABQ8FUK4_9PEZI|nr:hypothetical protein B0J12DRAFT_770802 [Macrophomina phaseolina]KAH7028253.1 hypothetical protein B0J12DRAFT_770816 [Macrophomina phaseolina]
MESPANVEKLPNFSDKGDGEAEEACSESGFSVALSESSSETSTVFEDTDSPVIEHGDLDDQRESEQDNLGHDQQLKPDSRCDCQEVDIAISTHLLTFFRFLDENLPCNDRRRVLRRATEELKNGMSVGQQPALSEDHSSAARPTDISTSEGTWGGADWCVQDSGIERSPGQGAAATTTGAPFCSACVNPCTGSPVSAQVPCSGEKCSTE